MNLPRNAAQCDYYAVLRSKPEANQEEIKAAFRHRALECHPDLHPNHPQKTEEFKQVNQAYEVLSDPGLRQQYDRLRPKTPSLDDWVHRTAQETARAHTRASNPWAHRDTAPADLVFSHESGSYNNEITLHIQARPGAKVSFDQGTTWQPLVNGDNTFHLGPTTEQGEASVQVVYLGKVARKQFTYQTANPEIYLATQTGESYIAFRSATKGATLNRVFNNNQQWVAIEPVPQNTPIHFNQNVVYLQATKTRFQPSQIVAFRLRTQKTKLTADHQTNLKSIIFLLMIMLILPLLTQYLFTTAGLPPKRMVQDVTLINAGIVSALCALICYKLKQLF
jgi:curved DNA-binding protein CbpA